jgi:hypothetical protein
MNEAQKYIAVAALAGCAVLAAFVEYGPRNSTPTPRGELSLRGKWIGPHAADDAAAFSGLCRGIADALEADGSRQQPRITSGVQVEDVRVAAAEGRFLPRRLTQEQPHAVAAAGKFLDEVAGTSGGPLDAAARAKWVQAYRQLATAAEESVR